ncbi:tRNA(His) guanylyltransferase Thg1 family protein [Chitinimonas lacunae]|uniref:tRNA(His) guanylyltransferase n=1 Tax=Chitinimonas lacunae TaxID=1963018 RepID=A0ABV8MW50_9NEIS
MRFDQLDARMRAFEAAADRQVQPDMHIVVRLDGRGFTRLTKERHDFERPFDVRFHDMMVETVRHLMQCGFRCLYGYSQSDEISLLLHRDEDAFARSEPKLLSLLAAEASARFSLLLGDMAVFDARLSLLPGVSQVVDYFRWRQEDAARNTRNAHCYWLCRAQGLSPALTAARLASMALEAKHELLFAHGINFNELPDWQKRGWAFYWHDEPHGGVDPRSGESRQGSRRRLRVEKRLPRGEDYGRLLATIAADGG